MNLQKIIYWVATAALCLLLFYSAYNYLSETETFTGYYEAFNYPTYLVVPMAIAKILGALMILWRGSKWLTEWAYAGLFFDFVLGFFAHYLAGESPESTLPLVAIVLLLISYFFGKVVRN